MNTTTWHISRHEAVSSTGMVAAKHPLAAEAGLQALRDGGNAVDAAITTALAMGVVDPAMNGIGGGGFMLFYEAKTGRTHVVDYFMTAPGAATPDMYEIVDEGKTDMLGFRGIKNDENIFGHRSVGVPGMVAGAALALEKFGALSLSQALQPAIRFADEGIPTTWYSMLVTGNGMDLLARFPASAAIFLKDGKYLLKAGQDRLVQTDLANTLKKIAADGPDAFYQGDIAKAMVDELAGNGNPISLADLAGYRARLLEPRSITYRDRYEVIYSPITGGGTLAETFNILEGFDLDGLDPNSAEALHLFIEAARIAYADRWQHLADEDRVDVPWHVLEAKTYASQRRAGINRDRAAATVAPWSPSAWRGSSAEGDGGCTTHLSVIDKDHNMVAITQTINLGWGSGVVIPGTGILMNDTMVLFDPRPGRANSIQGGKKPLSSMTPTLILRDGKPFATIGAPGGRIIMGTVMKVVHNILDYDMGIQEACASIAVDASADKIVLDAELGPAVAEGLRGRGHSLDIREKAFMPRPFASPTGILIDPDTGHLHGGADPYHPGVVVGY